MTGSNNEFDDLKQAFCRIPDTNMNVDRGPSSLCMFPEASNSPNGPIVNPASRGANREPQLDPAGVADHAAQIGRRMGDVLVGPGNGQRTTDNGRRFWDVLTLHNHRFAMCAISGSCSGIATLPWETLVLPGTRQPLLLLQQIRGRFDHANLCHGFGRNGATTRCSRTRKILPDGQLSPGSRTAEILLGGQGISVVPT
jgi:hypothetical protein